MHTISTDIDSPFANALKRVPVNNKGEDVYLSLVTRSGKQIYHGIMYQFVLKTTGSRDSFEATFATADEHQKSVTLA